MRSRRVAVPAGLVLAGALIFLSDVRDARFTPWPGIGVTLSAAQQAGDEAAVRAVVVRFHTAVNTGNAAAAMAVVAPDATFLEAGSIETRAEYEKDHLPADIAFEKGVTIKRTPIRVTVAGDTAWAWSTSEMVGTFQGRAIDSLGGELMVLTRTPAGWRIRAVHWSGRARQKPPA
jgi:ketosteroid isomerase-like protein